MKKFFCAYCGREILGDDNEGAILVGSKIIVCCNSMLKSLKLNKLN